MTVKKEYHLGDTVWIYGVGSNRKSTKGTVVKSFVIDYDGITDDVQYVIAVPTEVEYLLEIRTWQTISQDEQGPVGALRDFGKDLSATHKIAARTGYQYEHASSDEELDGPSADQIRAALEKSIGSVVHQPLVLKEPKAKPKRRFVRKKSKE